jgi:hypothetical protein
VFAFVRADCFYKHTQDDKTALDIAKEENKSAVVALLEK